MRVQRLLLLLTPVLVGILVVAALRGGDGAGTGLVDAVATSPTPEPQRTAPPAPAAAAPTGAPTPTASPAGTATPVPVPTSTGVFTYAPPAAAPVGRAPYRRYAVAVENGIGVEIGELARFVDETLADGRSWIGDTVTGFERVGEGEDVQFTLVVASPSMVDELCKPLNTAGIYSCGANGWIALNLLRWEGATEAWPTDIGTYRRYLVNHEVGHYILGPDHPDCPSPGAPAPIMMQQTIDLQGCAPNGWVYPG